MKSFHTYPFYYITKEERIIEKYLEYLRKSQFDRDYSTISISETLQRHRQILADFTRSKGIYVDLILEEVVSGETLTERPKMQELLKLVCTGEYAGVVCMDLDRLSRGSSFDSGYIMQALQYNDCKVVTPTKVYDLNDEEDSFSADTNFLFSRRELKTIRKRMYRGLEQSSKEGKWVSGHVPFGYERIKLSGIKGYTLKPEPKEAEVVKLIYKLYTADRMGYTAIAEHLDSLSLRTRKGHRWTAKAVGDIIKNETYTGFIFFGKHKQQKNFKDGEIVKSVKLTKDYELYEGLHEPIISVEQWNIAKAIREERNHAPKKLNTPLMNPFCGVLKCGNCGHVLIRNVAKKGDLDSCIRYRCRNPYCDCRTIVCSELEALIVEKMKGWLKDYELKIAKEDFKEKQEDNTELITAAENHIKELTAQQEKICELLEQGIYTVELFQKRNKALEDDIAASTASLKALRAQLEESQQTTQEQDIILPVAHRLLENYNSYSIEEKNEAWRAVLYKVTAYRKETGGKVEIVLYPRLK